MNLLRDRGRILGSRFKLVHFWLSRKPCSNSNPPCWCFTIGSFLIAQFLTNQFFSPVVVTRRVVLASHRSSNHRIVEWKRDATSGQVVAGGNGQGDRLNQLRGPSAVIVNKEKDSLIISDQGNRRLVQWPLRNGTIGQTIISDIDCWGLTMDNNGYFYVSDYKKNEVRRWRMGDTNGILVAGGNGKGNRLDQLDYPTYIFVDQDLSVYVSDTNNQRVMKWMEGAKEGIVVAGGQNNGDDQAQLSRAYAISVDQMGTVYAVEYDTHRVTRWFKEATQCSVVVGGNGSGEQANQLYYSTCLSFDRQGNLYVTDSMNHRVQKFIIESNSSS